MEQMCGYVFSARIVFFSMQYFFEQYSVSNYYFNVLAYKEIT